MNKAHFEIEQQYLLKTQNTLLDKIHLSDALCEQLSQTIKLENTNYLESMRFMNLQSLGVETINELTYQQKNLDNLIKQNDENIRLKNIYQKMFNNPYFARIDVKIANIIENYYIGIHTLSNNDNNSFLVLDWRSPVAGLFYDYDAGDAIIKTEEMSCELLNKRQYKIENGKLEYFFNTDITINDEILKETLAKLTSSKMKAIVQTIQKEQNAIIRNNSSDNLIVQGIAGSGKTSVALHRIAYLLYKNRDKIKSHDIALLSPNKAFSYYISSVLPDLAEEDIKKYQLDEIMRNELKKIAIIEDKIDQIERIINKNEEIIDYNFKTSSECYELIKEFAKTYISNSFTPKNIDLNGETIEANKIDKLFNETYSNQNIFTRILWISEYILSEHFYNITNKNKLNKLKGLLLKNLYSMLENKNPVKAYKVFLHSLHKDLILINGSLKNEDAYLLLYLKYHIFGFKKFNKIKYLVVDEMQDYSCVQFAIINMLFDCKKIFLGDLEQSINPENGVSNLHFLTNQLKNTEIISLNTSFRPTIEIANLFNYVGSITNSKVVSRNGEQPKVLIVDNKSIINITINEVKKLEKYNTIAIITKTKKQAKNLYAKLKDKIPVHLIDNSNKTYEGSVCILSAYASKGLEFDAVIAYDVSKSNYNNKVDNNLLYITLSRALHHISLISKDELNIKLKDYFALQNT